MPVVTDTYFSGALTKARSMDGTLGPLGPLGPASFCKGKEECSEAGHGMGGRGRAWHLPAI